MMKISSQLAETHYAPHKGKPFYEGLVQFMTSSPVVVLALEGKDAIAIAPKYDGGDFWIESCTGDHSWGFWGFEFV